MRMGLWRISLVSVGLLLTLAAPARAQTLLYGDSNLNGAVNMTDAADALGVLLTGACRLGNLGVNNDPDFNIKDILYIGQYAAVARAATDLSGDGVAPVTLGTASGNGQVFLSPGASAPLTTLATHRTLTGLCSDPTLLKQAVSIQSDATGTACGSGTTDACTNPDTCAGGSTTCNANNQPNGTVCAASGNFGCVLADTCTAGTCTDNGNAANFTPCDDGVNEPDMDTCQAGVCTVPPGCDIGDGVLQPGEECDLGSMNGQHLRYGGDLCRWHFLLSSRHIPTGGYGLRRHDRWL